MIFVFKAGDKDLTCVSLKFNCKATNGVADTILTPLKRGNNAVNFYFIQMHGAFIVFR